MKRLLIVALIPLLIAATAIIGTMWKQEGTILYPADDITAIDLSGITNILAIDTPSAYMHEDNNGGVGTFYNLSTTFLNWTTANDSDSTIGLAVDESASTITIGTGLGGRYVGTLHASFNAPTGKTITIGIFKNSTKIDDIRRSMAKGPERFPTFRSISSDDSSAVFDTQSSIDYLNASDGDDLIAIEAGTGNTGCAYVKVRVGEVNEPDIVRIGTSAYQSNNSNHWINVKMLNYSTNAYDDLNELAKDFEDVGATVEPYERVTWEFKVARPRRLYVENNISELLFLHNNVTCSDAHKIHLDEVKIIDAYSSAVVAFPVEFTVADGDVLSLKMKANEDDVDLLISDLGLNIFKIGL
jgi:hypothetical protein